MGYTATVTLDQGRAERISRNFTMISGQCDLSEYHQTGVAITDITGYFNPGASTNVRVICDCLSDNGYLVRWNASGGYFDAFYPTNSHVAQYEPDYAIAVKPTIALTYDADPAGNLNAVALYAYEAQGNCVQNTINLESTTNGNTSIWGETANGTVGLIACSLRFLVFDNNSPNGVKIYIAEDASDRLEFVSPTATDGYIIMPFEEAAGAPGGFACAVKVHHDAAAATGKDLFFDDNGAADAQLIFIDAGTTGGTIPAADISILAPAYLEDSFTATAAAANECANALDIGVINFMAIGLF